MAHVTAWKKETVEALKEIIRGHRTVAVVRIDGIPGVQLQDIRASLRGVAEIKVAKKNLIKLALQDMAAEKKDVDKLADMAYGQAALLGTELNPFLLHKKLKDQMQPMPAKGGETALEDIVIMNGETPFPPGPIVGELGKAGIPASIDKGKVVIKKKVTPVKKGGIISKDLALMLTKLEIFPFFAGIKIDGACEDGLVYRSDDLDIDMDAYRNDLTAAVQMAFNLAVFTAYVTPQTAPSILQKARAEAVNLAVYAGILTEDSTELILSKAYGSMLAMASLLSDDALDDDLRGLDQGAAAVTAPAPPEVEKAKEDKSKEEPEEEKVSEEDAVSGLGALFG